MLAPRPIAIDWDRIEWWLATGAELAVAGLAVMAAYYTYRESKWNAQAACVKALAATPEEEDEECDDDSD